VRRQQTSHARDLRLRATIPEQRIWYWLRHRYLFSYKFRRQHPIEGYILDFYCASLKLCIEIDGSSHDTEERLQYDTERTHVLSSRGITVVRVRNETIFEHPDGAWSLIADAVERAALRRQQLRS
jgi:very-short-patch-repair endonuclease